MDQDELKDLRLDLKNYKPGAVQPFPATLVNPPTKLCIGLFGRTGSGKTSLINSMKFALEGKFRHTQWLQVAGQEKSGSHTMFRTDFNLTEFISIIDNRGMDDTPLPEIISELQAQIDGKRDYNRTVEWKMGSDEHTVSNVSATGDKIMCAILVLSAKQCREKDREGTERYSEMDTEEIKRIKELINFFHMSLGRYPVAVITNADCDEANAKLKLLRGTLRFYGVSDICEVTNVNENKKYLEIKEQLNILELLDRCTSGGDLVIRFRHRQDIAERREEEERQRKRKEEQERKDDERRRQLHELELKKKRKEAELITTQQEQAKLQLEREQEKREKKKMGIGAGIGAALGIVAGGALGALGGPAGFAAGVSAGAAAGSALGAGAGKKAADV